MRLALLICDVPMASVLAEEGDYARIYSTWLDNSKPGSEYVMDAYDVKYKMEYPPKDVHYDGILLTGSGRFLSEHI
jgi:hypothetical protein